MSISCGMIMQFINSKLDKNFSVYKRNKTIIWGTGSTAFRCTEILEKHGVCIYAYCDNNRSKWGNLINNVKILSPKELYKLCNEEKVTLQIASIYYNEIKEQVKNYSFETIIISDELYCINECCEKRNILDKLSPKLKDIYINHMVEKKIQESYDNVFFKPFIKSERAENEYYLLIHSAPKTGNITLVNSLIKYSPCNLPIAFDHGFGLVEEEWIEYLKKQPLKIITGVRDPIAQLLSVVYQYYNYYWDIPYMGTLGDVEKIINDIYVPMIEGREPLDCFRTRYNNRTQKSNLVLNFFEEQFNRYLDINVFNYSFNKEKGYTIIKKNNIEIFIYQLEKLSNLENELKCFLNLKNFEIQNENIAENKSYAPYYQEAKKEMHLSKNMMNRMYNNDVTKFFYNDCEIQEMKRKWGEI